MTVYQEIFEVIKQRKADYEAVIEELERMDDSSQTEPNSDMNEEKPNQKARIKIPMEKIEKYFPAGTSEKKIEETILKALAMYRQRQKENRDAR